MIDTTTEDLLAAVRDALDLPCPGAAEDRPTYLSLARDRATATRGALDYALATGDLGGAVQMIDDLIGDMPVSYPFVPRQAGRAA